MKKIILSILLTTFIALSALADDSADVLATFDNFINDANSYSNNLPNYYVNNAKIIRVVNKKQGGQETVVIPYDRYLKELKAHSTIAKATGYKNTYTNKKVHKFKNDYKISATRYPRNDKIGLSTYFIFTKTNSGWKIKEESITTNVQTFLNQK